MKNQPLKLDIGFKSVPGTDHAYEDKIFVDGSRGLFAVADGVTLSSKGSGGVSARMSIYMLADFFKGDLKEAISMVNRTMSKLGAFDSGVGETTITAAFIKDGILHAANVGDSPAYLLRRESMTAAYVPDKYMSGGLSQYIPFGAGMVVHTHHMELQPGDIVVIASDGVFNILNPRDILSVAGLRMEDAAERLVGLSQSRRQSYDDDKSIILVKAERA
ncbi:MAG: PP2C family protein-serine/threonine phosphatase [Candidatus Micrarchaeaceae archaeon]